MRLPLITVLVLLVLTTTAAIQQNLSESQTPTPSLEQILEKYERGVGGRAAERG
jgi:hypothetical protein